jgi:hypothetical protein
MPGDPIEPLATVEPFMHPLEAIALSLWRFFTGSFCTDFSTDGRGNIGAGSAQDPRERNGRRPGDDTGRPCATMHGPGDFGKSWRRSWAMSIAPVDALVSWCGFLSVFALFVLSQWTHYAMGCPLPVGDFPPVNI